MTALELARVLRQAGVTLRGDGGQLHIDGPPEALTPDLLAELSSRKPELLPLCTWDESKAYDHLNACIEATGRLYGYDAEAFHALDAATAAAWVAEDFLALVLVCGEYRSVMVQRGVARVAA